MNFFDVESKQVLLHGFLKFYRQRKWNNANERDHKIDSVGAIIAMKENEDVIVQRERETENARRSNNRETDVNKEWKREGEIETERKIEREDVRVDRGRKK